MPERFDPILFLLKVYFVILTSMVPVHLAPRASMPEGARTMISARVSDPTPAVRSVNVFPLAYRHASVQSSFSHEPRVGPM